MALLLLAHHDFWLWEERDLVWGFLPVGLAYHMAYSIAAAAFWILALKFSWPSHLEEWAGQNPEQKEPGA